MLGFLEGGQMVKKHFALFADRLVYWNKTSDMLAQNHPIGQILLTDVKSLEQVNGGFVLRHKGRKMGLNTSTEAETKVWSSNLLAMLAPPEGSSPTAQALTRAASPKGDRKRYVAVADFIPQSTVHGELPIRKGEEVFVTSPAMDGWILGTKIGQNSGEGWLPENLLIESDHSRARTQSPASRGSFGLSPRPHHWRRPRRETIDIRPRADLVAPRNMARAHSAQWLPRVATLSQFPGQRGSLTSRDRTRSPEQMRGGQESLNRSMNSSKSHPDGFSGEFGTDDPRHGRSRTSLISVRAIGRGVNVSTSPEPTRPGGFPWQDSFVAEKVMGRHPEVTPRSPLAGEDCFPDKVTGITRTLPARLPIGTCTWGKIGEPGERDPSPLVPVRPLGARYADVAPKVNEADRVSRTPPRCLVGKITEGCRTAPLWTQPLSTPTEFMRPAGKVTTSTFQY